MEENKPLITENESVKKTIDLLIEIKKLEQELSLLETYVLNLISLIPRVAPLKTLTLEEALKEENIDQYKGIFVDTLPPQQRERLIPSDFNPRECTSLEDFCEKATAIMGERIHPKPVASNKKICKKKRQKDDTESVSDKKEFKKKK